MNREGDKPIVTDRYGTVRDIGPILDDLSDEVRELLKEILVLLKELNVPVQIGHLEDNREGGILRYIFKGIDILKENDCVLYKPLNNGGKFKAIVKKKEEETQKGPDYQ